MSEAHLVAYQPQLHHPPGYRPRRGLNWAFIGLLYTSYYMCRYNFSIANKTISTEFQYSLSDMGWIITTTSLAYAFGQIINGMLTDKIGGKKAMLIGAAGTIAMNLAFGAASFVGNLGLFVAIWGVNGYVQSLGAPGMIKINAAWFDKRERGRFAGIFGFMINLGRFGIFRLGPALLAGFIFLGMFHVGPLHWRWLFWTPSIICALVAVGVWIFVKETPEEAGFHHLTGAHASKADEETHATVRTVFLAIASNPAIWLTATAYACTGAVRQAVDQWFPRYMEDMHNLKLDDPRFQWLGFLIPFVASVGSLASGFISDLFFKSRRAPVAAGLYFIETLIILSAARFVSVDAAILFFVLISLTANSTHSLLGTAAAMDIGGRKMSGFASGLIDSFQYFGGSLAGLMLGRLIDTAGWETYFYFMAPFGFLGCILMMIISIRGVTKEEQRSRKKRPVLAAIYVTAMLAILIAAAYAGLSAYGTGKSRLPESIARVQFQNAVSRASDKNIAVVGFQRTNTAVGSTTTDVDVAAVLEFRDDCQWYGQTASPGLNFEVISAHPSPFAANKVRPKDYVPPQTPAKKGDRVTITGKAHYQYTDKGWQIKID